MSGLPPDVLARRERGRMLHAGGLHVFTEAYGDAGSTDVLVLHGFPSSSHEWRHVAPLVADAGARVVLFDLAGCGLSSKPFDRRVTLFEQADIAEAVAAAHGIERCVLVAHDMGDTVAAELLCRANVGALPFAVDRTVLTNGSIFIDMAQLSAGQQFLLALPDEPLPEPLPLDGFRDGIAQTFSHEHQPAEEEITAMLALIAHEGGDRLLPRLIRYVEERRANQERWTSGLVDFAGPLTAIWGEQDPIAVVAMTDRLRSLRPATEVVRWADVGHWPAIEVPERLAAEIVARL